MSNWFKKHAQPVPGENAIPDQIDNQEEIRYRVVVPIDLKIISKGNDIDNEGYVYGTLRTLFDVGSEHIKDMHKGINVMLDFNDIKPFKNII